jgi:chemotaxis protein methyltransferase CheR
MALPRRPKNALPKIPAGRGAAAFDRPFAPRPKPASAAGPESIEVELLLLGLFRRYGYDFRSYDPSFLRPHIEQRAREEGVDSISRLSERFLRDPAVLERFLAQLSGGGPPLFSPSSFWRSLRTHAVPYLRTYPTVRLWALEARPEELCSLAILADEDLPRNVRIYATRMHETLVEGIRTCTLDPESVRKAAREYRRSGGRRRLADFFETADGAAALAPALRRRITFASYNPVTDGPFQHFHAILARGLLRPFDRELRGKTCRLLHESLIPLGFLALGPRGALEESPFREAYRELDRAAGLYQKIRE